MPHCIIEHSSTINAEDLLKPVFEGALKSSLFDKNGNDIKVRTVSYTHYLTGTEKSDFIHVIIKILSGRTTQQKLLLSETIINEVKLLNISHCSITVEVVDIERETYSKVLVGKV